LEVPVPISYKVCGNCDSWCGKCKLLLAHTIETMDGPLPARVQCNTCHQQHAFKDHKPGEVRTGMGRAPRAPAGPKRATPGAARASHYEELMKSHALEVGRTYSPKEKFAVGDVVQHPTFGLGVTTAVKDAKKVEVLFHDGARVLIQGL
jgi:hypothetical protein